MLTAVDAVASGIGLAPDPAVPTRDLLLDPDVLADQLGVVDAVIVRVKYRVGESLRVVVRLGLADGSRRVVSGRTARSGAGLLGATWWIFPDDRRLRDIAQLVAPDPGLDPALATLVGGRAWRTSEVVEYAPERSVTIRASASPGRPVAYVKAFAPGTVDVVALQQRYDQVAAALARRSAIVSSPRALGADAGAFRLALDPLPGTRWSELAGFAPLAERGLLLLGAGLALLHTIDPPSDAGLGRFGRFRPDRVRRSAEIVALARPDLAPLVEALARDLRDGPPAGERAVLLHGDCHPKNALLDGDRVGLVDLDQAGIGPASADLGGLVARLLDDGLAAGLVLEGYRAVRPLPPSASLRWHVRAAVLAERAVRAVNRVRPDALERLGTLLEAAAAPDLADAWER